MLQNVSMTLILKMMHLWGHRYILQYKDFQLSTFSVLPFFTTYFQSIDISFLTSTSESLIFNPAEIRYNASIREEMSSCIPELPTELNESNVPTNPNPVFQWETPGNNSYGSFPNRSGFLSNKNMKSSTRGQFNAGNSRQF